MATTLDLKPLRAKDPHIQSVSMYYKRAAVFEFGLPGSQSPGWRNKLTAEGPLYLVSREEAPRYRIMVLNKLSLDNFLLSLDAIRLSELRELADGRSVLQVVTDEGKLFGIWIEGNGAESLSTRITDIRNRAGAETPPTEAFLNRPMFPAAVPTPLPTTAASAFGAAPTGSGVDTSAARAVLQTFIIKTVLQNDLSLTQLQMLLLSAQRL